METNVFQPNSFAFVFIGVFLVILNLQLILCLKVSAGCHQLVLCQLVLLFAFLSI